MLCPHQKQGAGPDMALTSPSRACRSPERIPSRFVCKMPLYNGGTAMARMVVHAPPPSPARPAGWRTHRIGRCARGHSVGDHEHRLRGLRRPKPGKDLALAACGGPPPFPFVYLHFCRLSGPRQLGAARAVSLSPLCAQCAAQHAPKIICIHRFWNKAGHAPPRPPPRCPHGRSLPSWR